MTSSATAASRCSQQRDGCHPKGIATVNSLACRHVLSLALVQAQSVGMNR
jgi:hypothetical protein